MRKIEKKGREEKGELVEFAGRILNITGDGPGLVNVESFYRYGG